MTKKFKDFRDIYYPVGKKLKFKTEGEAFDAFVFDNGGSVRAYNGLTRLGFTTIDSMYSISLDELLNTMKQAKFRLGEIALEEIRHLKMVIDLHK